MGSEFMIDLGLYLVYLLLGIGVLASVGFPLVEVFRNLEAAKKMLISVGSLLVIFGLSYALSGNEVLDSYQKFGITPSSSKLIGAALIMLYITSILTLVLLIVGEILNALR
ncbi:MAG: hypothetical protein RLZZ617_420 [Bacteroidota bacterium]|jgi:sulfite exporter TauE/SafE